MCGLFGWSINPDMVEKIDLHSMAALLAYQADRRGNDSWGVSLQTDPHGVPVLIKDVGSIRKTCRIRSIIAPQVIGHTRAATVGKVSVANSHPFHIGDIIGAHNGHVQNYKDMNEKHKRNYEVDSQHIFAHINEDLPIEELSGSGTITFLDLKEPGKIFFGRGQFSDLEIFSLGPTNKPWGTVWCSIGMWGEDALDLAGVKEYDSWTTHYNTIYELEDHHLYDVGEFNLKNTYTQSYPVPARCGQVSQMPPRIWNERDKTYETSKDMEEYWGKLRQERIRSGHLKADDVESLPEALKKNQEIGVLATGQDQETIEASIQCDACNRWGIATEDYADRADGIVKIETVDQYLCYQCCSFWGSYTGQRETIDIPKLSLNMEY